MYKWKEVKLLSKKGMGKKKIARKLKMSINTVRKYINEENPPEFHEREYNPDILNLLLNLMIISSAKSDLVK